MSKGKEPLSQGTSEPSPREPGDVVALPTSPDDSLHWVRKYNKTMRDRLVEKIEELVGADKPPCEFALFGLGSLATGTMVPGSDFEFAILLPDELNDGSNVANKQTAIDYFNQLTDNIAEAIKPYKIEIDSAGTHPKGLNGKNALIGCKDELLIFHEPEL